MEPATSSKEVPGRVAEAEPKGETQAEPKGETHSVLHEEAQAALHGARDDEHVRGLLLIGLFKLCKCLLAICSGAAAYHLAHTDPGEWAMKLVDALPINPVGKIAMTIMNQADSMTAHGLRQLGMASFLLAGLYLLEGTGLMMQRVWAEYLTVVMTAGAIPWEVHELADRYTHIKLGLLLVNVAVVVYLAVVLARKRRAEQGRKQEAANSKP